jgi:hypothetical protein
MKIEKFGNGWDTSAMKIEKFGNGFVNGLLKITDEKGRSIIVTETLFFESHWCEKAKRVIEDSFE